ncbi:MAG TPA: hypothetical protein VNG69_08930 [Casimicrobiaceae bacterium]|nr:hypothetical protein [Casimicrobiaceae bacterium]
MAAIKRRITWFEFLMALFGAALPVGLVLMLVAPVSFLHAMGAVILGMAMAGLWISVLGLQLEHPERWVALKGSLVRIATVSSPRH